MKGQHTDHRKATESVEPPNMNSTPDARDLLVESWLGSNCCFRRHPGFRAHVQDGQASQTLENRPPEATRETLE